MSSARNILLMTGLVGPACIGAAPAEGGPVPPIDAAAPAKFETATFALG